MKDIWNFVAVKKIEKILHSLHCNSIIKLNW